MLTLVCLSASAYDVIKNPHLLYQVTYKNNPRFWLNGNFHLYPYRKLLPNIVNCKVNERAPEFACR